MSGRYHLGDVISNWNHLIDNFNYSSNEFYNALGAAILDRKLPDVKFGTVILREGSILSAQRTYLRVQWHGYFFDICGAPFGRGFFVSWWLSEKPGCIGRLAEMHVLGLIFKALVAPITYYKVDTALMFQQSIHATVLEVVDRITAGHGVRALTEFERKPVMREFFGR